MSWWGPTSSSETTIHDYYLPHPRFGELDFAIHYESKGRFKDFDNPDYSTFVDDFRYLAANYFGQPNYLKVDGKPVVFMYLTRAYFKDQASRDLVGTVRDTIRFSPTSFFPDRCLDHAVVSHIMPPNKDLFRGRHWGGLRQHGGRDPYTFQTTSPACPRDP